MYKELIENLRFNARQVQQYGSAVWKIGTEILLFDAANAIEELSRRETPMEITEIHVDEYYCPACRAENNCDQGDVQDTYCPACGQRLLPKPC